MSEEAYTLTDQFGSTLSAQILVDGLRMNTLGKPVSEVAADIRNIKTLPIREDDVLLCSSPKNGTHWCFEIISMLLKGKAETVREQKTASMLVNISHEKAEKLPSPRVLNTHVPYERLPEQVKQRKTKIVFVVRNPKDAVVSFYHHHLGLKLFNYTGTFSGHLPWFLDGNLEFNSWFDYVLGFEKAMAEGEVPIHLLYYEDLKENGVEEIRRMARFLGVPDDEALCQAIYDKVQLQNMRVDKAYAKDLHERIFTPGFTLFRKGVIGDWKNYFTVAENEAFDRIYEERMKSSKLKIRFTPS